MKLYINLHPKYNYAMAHINGYIDIKSYVKNINWLTWVRTGSTYYLQISGEMNEIGSHFLRVKVFAQRMLNKGFEVFIRNERCDDWETFENQSFTNDEMLEVELENSATIEISDVKKDLHNLKTYLQNSPTEETKHTITESIYRQELRLVMLEEKQKDKIKIIKNFWS